jgi:hypothetical protein
MPSTTINHFSLCIDRTNNLLLLYDILFDKRERKVRKDWSQNFCSLMHWSTTEKFIRIDGKDSIIILKSSLNIDQKLFKTNQLDELLRSIIVYSVSALDRYFHDVLVEKVISILSKKEEEIPKELKNLNLPILSTKKALEKLKKDGKSRPGNILKSEIQIVLHDDYTFQNVHNIDKAIKMLDISDFWNRVGNEFSPKLTPIQIQNKIREISKRRNEIVHEADIVRKLRAKKPTLKSINRNKVEEYKIFIDNFIRATDKIINI